MPRIARVVAPGLPHHITQRGNRRQRTFFREADYALYIDLLAQWTAAHDVEIWAYCLMPNHVHLIAAPASETGLCRGIGEAHRRYTCAINLRKKWRGCLWQGRFASYVLDDNHLRSAARYIALNPVRAGLVSRPEEWPWSSARAHLERSGDDPLTRPAAALLDHVEDFAALLELPDSPETAETLRRHERTGRPLGSLEFLKQLENKLERTLVPQKPGRKKKKEEK